MSALFIILSGFLGSAIGSFLNVCIDRLPQRKSIVFPPSHCDSCRHKLSWRDLLPVISFLWLRRRCRYCKSPIPWRVFWVELGTGLLFAFTCWYYGLTAQFAVTAFYECLFIIIMVIDLEHKLILNRLVYPSIIIALLIDIVMPPGIIKGLIGGGAGFALILLPALIFPGGMGWGDVKLAALIGFIFGFPLVFVALFIGILLGGSAAIILLASRKRKRKDVLPFGTFLALASIVTLFWGNEVLAWYMGFFNF